MSDSRSLIDRCFYQWVEGKDPVGARITIFEKIRDIPYAVIPELIDSEKYAGILKVGRGSCTPKHFLLAEMFQRLGILVLFAVYPFRWGERSEIMADYLVRLREMAQTQPTGYHLACKAEIKGKLVVVDATLDSSLAKLPVLPVNLKWDGFSDTSLPVTPVGEELVFHPVEAHRMRPRVDEQSLAFYRELNRCLETIRNIR